MEAPVPFRVVNRKKKRFIRPELSVAEIFDVLERRGVRHRVLRWFEDLPRVAAGEDVDVGLRPG